ITSELHSPAKAEQAAAALTRQFTEGQIPEDVEDVTIEANGSTEMNVVDVLMKGLKKSRSESRRLVEQGGVSVDGSRSNLETALSTDSEHDLKYGKRSHARIRWR